MGKGAGAPGDLGGELGPGVALLLVVITVGVGAGVGEQGVVLGSRDSPRVMVPGIADRAGVGDGE